MKASIKPHLLVTCSITIIYAILRYNVFKGISWVHFPTFVLNKAFSVTAIVLIALAYLVTIFPRLGSPALAKPLGIAGYSFAMIHMVLSLVVISPAYFDFLYLDNGRMNLYGELTFLFGAIGLYCFTLPAIGSIPGISQHLSIEQQKKMHLYGFLGMWIIAVHVVAVGINKWLNFFGKLNTLPPISLLAFCVVLFTIAVKQTQLWRKSE